MYGEIDDLTDQRVESDQALIAVVCEGLHKLITSIAFDVTHSVHMCIHVLVCVLTLLRCVHLQVHKYDVRHKVNLWHQLCPECSSDAVLTQTFTFLFRYEIMLQCTRHDANKRPTFDQLCHKLVSKLKFSEHTIITWKSTLHCWLFDGNRYQGSVSSTR